MTYISEHFFSIIFVYLRVMIFMAGTLLWWTGKQLKLCIYKPGTYLIMKLNNLTSMDWAKTTARWYKKHLSSGIWCDLYWRFYGNQDSDQTIGNTLIKHIDSESPRPGVGVSWQLSEWKGKYLSTIKCHSFKAVLIFSWLEYIVIW